MNLFSNPEYATLIDRYVLGELTQHESDRLLSILADNPDVAVAIYDQFQGHFWLERHFESETALQFYLKADRIAQPAPVPDRNVISPLKNEKSGLPRMTVLLVFVAVIAGFFLYYRQHQDYIVDPASGPVPIAIVCGTLDAVWQEDVPTPKLGEVVSQSQFQLRSGLVELLFYNGTRLIMEGPADLSLLSTDQVFSRNGSFSFKVPPSGHGFKVQTPHAVITDLGTEFLVQVDSDQTVANVIRGKIEFQLGNGRSRILNAGDSFGTARKENLLKSDAYISPSTMRDKRDEFLLRDFTAMKTAMPKDAVRTVDFRHSDLEKPVGGVSIYGGTVGAGAVPGTNAFHFHGPSDRILLHPLGTPDAFTAVVRLRIDLLKTEINPILMSAGAKKGGIVWQIQSQGTILAGIRQPSRGGSGVIQSPVFFNDELLGRWIDLVLTMNFKSRQIAVYVDGDPVLTGKLPPGARGNLDDLDVACWQPQSGEENKIRQIDGSVEKITIFDRVLGIDEIRLLYLER